MKVAVLGTGMVGRAIAVKLTELGHEVVIGTRDVGKTLAQKEPDRYGNPPFATWLDERPSLALDTFAAAAGHGDPLIVNCTSGMASMSALEMAGEANLRGKVLVDIANPLDFSRGMPPTLDPVNTDSLAEQIQRAFPELKVVKTLNTMNARLMVDPSLVRGDHTVFVSGNDAGAKAEVGKLLRAFGWAPHNILDLGDIGTARGTEMLLPIWLRLWGALGTAEFNFHIQRNG